MCVPAEYSRARIRYIVYIKRRRRRRRGAETVYVYIYMRCRCVEREGGTLRSGIYHIYICNSCWAHVVISGTYTSCLICIYTPRRARIYMSCAYIPAPTFSYTAAAAQSPIYIFFSVMLFFLLRKLRKCRREMQRNYKSVVCHFCFFSFYLLYILSDTC